jgi:hypothetical protein
MALVVGDRRPTLTRLSPFPCHAGVHLLPVGDIRVDGGEPQEILVDHYLAAQDHTPSLVTLGCAPTGRPNSKQRSRVEVAVED